MILQEVGYLELVVKNGKFRTLWLASIISFLGEWFNFIALFTLIITYTGSEALVGTLVAIRMLGFGLLQPIIGLISDRWSRKWIMVYSCGLQVFIALSFLLVDGKEDMWWMIGLSGLMMLLHGVYITAERAALPNIVSAEELATANALTSATWSAALAIGASLGGIVVSQYGTDVAFLIDSVTFLIAALMIVRLQIPQTVSDDMRRPLLRTAFSNISAGMRRIMADPRVKRIVFAKASWNIAGGGLTGVFLTLAGSDIEGVEIAAGIGIFFMARGIGTGVGPIVARQVFKDKDRWPSLVGILVAFSGVFYALVSLSLGGDLWLTIVLITIAHAASGANWVLSTILTQQWVEDEMRGRVFSTDIVILSGAFVTSALTAGWMLENTNISLENGMLYFALTMIAVGIAFTMWRPDNRADHSHST